MRTRLSFLCFFILISAVAHGEVESQTVAEFAEVIVQDFNDNDGKDLVRSVNMDKVIETAMGDLLKTTKSAVAFSNGFKSTAHTIGPSLAKNIPDYGYVKLVRAQESRGGGTAMIRIPQGDGIAFLEFRIARSDGKLEIIDWRNYSSGDKLSEVIRNAYLLFVPEKSLLDRFLGGSTDDRELQRLVDLAKAYKQRDFPLFFAIYDSLGEESRATKLVSVIGVQVANLSGDMERYEEFITHLAENFGQDPGMAFVMMDYYFVQGEYQKALDQVETFSMYLGVKDSALLAMQSTAATLAGHQQKGIKLALESMAIEPELEDGYWAALLGYVLATDYKSAVGIIDTMESAFDYVLDKQALAGNEYYASFVGSVEFRDYSRSR